ncbi:metal-dependent hydrolase [Fulvitalea axinellae]
MKITYLGHSSFHIETQGVNIILDPFISPNPLAKDIDIAKIKADYILLSHGHEDHIYDVEAIVSNNLEAIVVANYEIVSYFGKKGIPGHPMNTGGTKEFPFGSVRMENALHSSSFPDGSYAGCPAGFTLRIEDKTLYYAGDTDVFGDMKMIGERNPIDLAFLPIGDNFTMGIDGALQAADLLGVDKFVGMHFDTFPPIAVDAEKTAGAALKAQKELLLLGVGHSLNL